MEEVKTDETLNSDVQTDENEKTAEFTHPLHDIGNAERFVQRHGENLKFSPELKAWLINTDDHWEIQQTKALLYQLGKETIHSIYNEAKREDLSSGQKQDLIKHANSSSSKSRINAMLDLASMEPIIQINANLFNKNLWLLNCANGTLNLETKC